MLVCFSFSLCFQAGERPPGGRAAGELWGVARCPSGAEARCRPPRPSGAPCPARGRESDAAPRGTRDERGSTGGREDGQRLPLLHRWPVFTPRKPQQRESRSEHSRTPAVGKRHRHRVCRASLLPRVRFRGPAWSVKAPPPPPNAPMGRSVRGAAFGAEALGCRKAPPERCAREQVPGRRRGPRRTWRDPGPSCRVPLSTVFTLMWRE